MRRGLRLKDWSCDVAFCFYEDSLETIQRAIESFRHHVRYIFAIDGKFEFNNMKIDLKKDESFVVKVFKDNFLNESSHFTTFDIRKKIRNSEHAKYFGKIDKNYFVVDFYLLPITTEEILIPNIYFEYGKWSLTEASLEYVVLLKEMMEDNPGLHVIINSHTDMRGSLKANQRLSEKRAKAVLDYLVDGGIQRDRLFYWWSPNPK